MDRDIVIATVARFHYDSLAIGLDKRGRLNRFYSGLPRSKLRCQGLERSRFFVSPWLQVPYMALCKFPQVPRQLLHRMARTSQVHLDKVIARTLPDCQVYAAMSGCGLISGKVAQQRGIRYVCERGTAHIRYNDELLRQHYDQWKIPYEGTDSLMMEREEAEYQQADRLIVLCEANVKSFVERGVDPQKIRVVPLCIQPTGIPGPEDRGADFRVLFVGATTVAKGLGHLVDAFKKARIDGSILQIVGQPSNDLNTFLRRGSCQRVQYLGGAPYKKVLQLMREAHVLVLPSLTEGSGLVVSEALSCGTPVIISDIFSESFHVKHEFNGLIVPVADTDALAAALIRVNEDRDLLRLMGINGVTSVPYQNDMSAYAETWIPAVCD